jgi:hypothetical protein
MNRELEIAAAELCDVAAGSVEYSDWPELQDAIERVRKALPPMEIDSQAHQQVCASEDHQSS